jgi:hypothetical protein
MKNGSVRIGHIVDLLEQSNNYVWHFHCFFPKKE